MDSSILIAAGASFIAGLTGYIIARLWVKPMVQYNITKRKIGRSLSQCGILLEVLGDGQGRVQWKSGEDASLKKARRHAMDLATCYNEKIPYWYRLFLDSRGESPAEASGLLTNLNKMTDVRQIQDRIDGVREKLRLK